MGCRAAEEFGQKLGVLTACLLLIWVCQQLYLCQNFNNTTPICNVAVTARDT